MLKTVELSTLKLTKPGNTPLLGNIYTQLYKNSIFKKILTLNFLCEYLWMHSPIHTSQTWLLTKNYNDKEYK